MHRLALLAAGSAAIWALAGCNQVFGLDAPGGGDDGADAPPVDAPGVRHTFDSVEAVPVGLSPRAMGVADFDHDGAEDLAVASFAASTVSVIRCPARTCVVTELAAGNGPTAVVTLDVDDSNTPDLAVVAAGDQHVNLFSGNGDGSFDLPTVFIDALCTTAVAGYFAGGDEAIDLLVGDSAGVSVSRYRNNAAGSLALVDVFTVPEPVELMVAGSLVADAATEVVVAFGNQLQVISFESDSVTAIGDGLPGGASALAIGDVDSDERGDLIAAGSGKLEVWRGVGNGGFVGDPSLAIEAGEPMLAVGELDGGGGDDVVVVDRATGLVRFFVVGSGGPLEEPAVLGGGGGVTAIALADVDGDGLDDLVLVRGNTAQVEIFFART